MQRMKKKGKKLPGKSSTKVTRRKVNEWVMREFLAAPTKRYNYKQMASVLGLKKVGEKHLVLVVLSELANKGNLLEVAPGKYKLNSTGSYLVGRLRRENDGVAWLVPIIFVEVLCRSFFTHLGEWDCVFRSSLDMCVWACVRFVQKGREGTRACELAASIFFPVYSLHTTSAASSLFPALNIIVAFNMVASANFILHCKVCIQ